MKIYPGRAFIFQNLVKFIVLGACDPPCTDGVKFIMEVNSSTPNFTPIGAMSRLAEAKKTENCPRVSYTLAYVLHASCW